MQHKTEIKKQSMLSETWHNLTPEEALKALNGSLQGLTQNEAKRRLELYGPNTFSKSKRPGWFLIYLKQFKSPLMYMLLIAAGISFGIQQISDAVFILCVLQLNATLGSFQEWKAESQAEALDKILVNYVTVKRGKMRRRVTASQLVPGDIILLESGDYVPADSLLLKTYEVLVDESTLTGESLPIRKATNITLPIQTFLGDRINMLFAGSLILNGRVEALVVGTASQTELGRIAKTLAKSEAPDTPLLMKMKQFTKFIGFLTIGAALLIGSIQLLQGQDLREVFMVAVALAVSAIPEGLPVALTVALSIARYRMGKRNVIVRILSAIEGLGAATLIASDKTGTLTCNELTIKLAYIPQQGMFEVEGSGYSSKGKIKKEGRPVTGQELGILQKLAITGSLCNEATFQEDKSRSTHFGDTVDVSFLVLASKLGLSKEKLFSYFPERFLIPFESSRRFAASYNKDGDAYRVHVKGAAEVIFPMCKSSDREELIKVSEELAHKGYRVLVLASKVIKSLDGKGSHISAEKALNKLHDLECVGIVGIIDPVRGDASSAIAACKKAGIQVVMISGDHPATALTIAQKLKIATTPEDVITGKELTEFASIPAEIDRLVKTKKVFARVEPLQKFMIIEAFQRLGHFVAVTGDGVNDAPALHEANIGVAMGEGGTDIARKAADIILVDDKFSSIVAGIFEGRIAYDNIRKVIYLLLSTGFAEIILFFASTIANLPIPLFATQLLWLNLVTNGIQDVSLAFEKGEKGTLKKPPRPPKEPIFNRLMVGEILISGGFIGIIAFLFFWIALKLGWSANDARNSLFLLMVVFENLHLLNCRSEEKSLFRIRFFSNPLLLLSLILAHGVHLVAMYTPGLKEVLRIHPISFTNWLTTFVVGLSIIVVMETYKRLILAKRKGFYSPGLK